jgi:hypothetical protein
MLLVFYCSYSAYHQGSFLSLSFNSVSWEEVSVDFKQRMKALRKSLLFRVVAEHTKSNKPYRVCMHLAVVGTKRPEFISQSCRSRGASLTFSKRVTPNYSVKVRNWSLTRVALFCHRCFLTPLNNQGESTRPDPENIWDTSDRWFLGGYIWTLSYVYYASGEKS